MSNANSSQKFIGRNRAPRVQIEYDVEVYGSEKKVELPFVMGVLADLSGKPTEALPAVSDRKFLDIDIDNFDERMKPRNSQRWQSPKRPSHIGPRFPISNCHCRLAEATRARGFLR